MEHELWLTALFNQFLAGPGNAARNLAGLPAENPAHPWTNFVAMEILVAAVIVVVFGILRARMSMDKPGKLQHTFELIFDFLHGQVDESIGHRGQRYIAYFGTLFIFILFANLLGLIPTFESPTMFPGVPLGCALATFVYYNFVGARTNGIFRYMKHFTGPMPALAPLMLPIEIMSNLARPLSLTIRLFANMFAGEQVTLAFMGIVPLLVPLPFMGLHIFVAFLQAYVFTLLTMVYVGDVLPHEEHAH